MSFKNINPSSKIKKILSIAVFGALIIVPNMKAYADVYVKGYYRSNGTYVDPHTEQVLTILLTIIGHLMEIQIHILDKRIQQKLVICF